MPCLAAHSALQQWVFAPASQNIILRIRGCDCPDEGFALSAEVLVDGRAEVTGGLIHEQALADFEMKLRTKVHPRPVTKDQKAVVVPCPPPRP